MTSTVLHSRHGLLSTDRFDRAVALLLAAAMAANGGFMLIDPTGWYRTVPGVVHTGPANTHFIYDIGIAFLTSALTLAWAALRPAVASALYGIATIFLGGHAGLHFLEYLHHGVPESWATDLVGIALPAFLSLLLTLRAVARHKET